MACTWESTRGVTIISGFEVVLEENLRFLILDSRMNKWEELIGVYTIVETGI